MDVAHVKQPIHHQKKQKMVLMFCYRSRFNMGQVCADSIGTVNIQNHGGTTDFIVEPYFLKVEKPIISLYSLETKKEFLELFLTEKKELV